MNTQLHVGISQNCRAILCAPVALLVPVVREDPHGPLILGHFDVGRIFGLGWFDF